jgi:hypothetical protein
MKSIAYLTSFTLALFLTMPAGNASATVVSADYANGSGDGWITIDSSTGLKWLDVSITAGQTFDQVRTGIWYSRGFRYATKDELKTLFANAGTPDDNFDVTITHPAKTLALAQLLGPTLVNPGRVSVAGFIGTDGFDEVITLSNHPVGQAFSAQLGKIDYLDLTPYGGIYGEAHFTGGHPRSNSGDSYYGSFLVSSVPEPDTYAMVLLGLLGVATFVRKKQM